MNDLTELRKVAPRILPPDWEEVPSPVINGMAWRCLRTTCST
jgi:hypothetical protein